MVNGFVNISIAWQRTRRSFERGYHFCVSIDLGQGIETSVVETCGIKKCSLNAFAQIPLLICTG